MPTCINPKPKPSPVTKYIFFSLLIKHYDLIDIIFMFSSAEPTDIDP